MAEKPVDTEAILNRKHELKPRIARVAGRIVYGVARYQRIEKPTYANQHLVQDRHPVVYVPNHQLNEDIPLVDTGVKVSGGLNPLTYAIGERFYRPSLLRIKVGRLMEFVGGIAVARLESDLPRAVKTEVNTNYHLKTVEYLTKGVSAVSFGEGTRYPLEEHQIKPIQNGPLLAAKDARVPIQPISIFYKRHKADDRLDPIVVFGELIDPPGIDARMPERKEINAAIHDSIQEGYYQGAEILGVDLGLAS